MTKIAIVMLHFGSISTTKNTLRNLATKITQDTTLYLVNNTSSSVTSICSICPQTVLIDNRQNLGFAKGVNQGIKRAIKDKADYIALMNNDLIITSGSIQLLTTSLRKDPQVGIVAPVLNHSYTMGKQGLYDWGGAYSSWLGRVKHINWPSPPKTTLTVDHTAAALIMFPSDLINAVGYFDERFFLYYEDLDFSLRVRSHNYKIIITPQVIAWHATSLGTTLTKRTLYQFRSHIQFVTKHLFRHTYPTAYLYSFILYPLVIIKSLLKR